MRQVHLACQPSHGRHTTAPLRYKTATIAKICNTTKKEYQKNTTTWQKVTLKPARKHGKTTYHDVTHLAAWQENTSLESQRDPQYNKSQ
jgi:hypothetical protein